MIIVYDITFRMLPAWMYETFNEEFVERFKDMISIKKHIKYDIGDLSHINLEIPIDKEYLGAGIKHNMLHPANLDILVATFINSSLKTALKL